MLWFCPAGTICWAASSPVGKLGAGLLPGALLSQLQDRCGDPPEIGLQRRNALVLLGSGRPQLRDYPLD